MAPHRGHACMAGVVQSGHSCWGALRQDVRARSTVAMIAAGVKALVRGEEVAPKAPAAPAQPPAAPSRIVTVGTQALARALLQGFCQAVTWPSCYQGRRKCWGGCWCW